MTLRQTSLEAYRHIESEGLLSRVRFEVYSILFHHGPLTMADIHKRLSKGRSVSGGTYTSRLSELERMGVIREVKRVKCPITGRTATLWDVTSSLPIKFEKPKKLKCKACDGKGFHLTEQSRFDI